MKRFLLIGLVVLVAVVGVAAFLLYSSIDSIVKAAIEKVGSDVTGTDVRVDEVEISLADGSGRLRGFRVVNPDGFEREDAFRFDEIRLTLDLATIASDPVVIKELVIERPRIRYEFGGSGTNVGTIQKNVSGYSADSAPAEEPGPNIVIQHLYFRGGEITVAGSKMLDKGVAVSLPDLHVTDIGSEPGGASPATVAKKVIGRLGREVTTAMASIDVDKLGHKTEDAAKSVEKKIGGLFKKRD